MAAAPPVVDAYRGFGAAACVPIYNALDPTTHFPVPPDPRFACDLAFLGNRLPDREARVEEFFLEARGGAARAAIPDRRQWLGDKAMPANVRHRGHVYTAEHNAFNCTPKAVLNVARDSMAHVGFSPATRVFEAAGAGCLPDHRCLGRHREIPEARQGSARRPRRTGRGRAHAPRSPPNARTRSAERRCARVLADHTYARARCAGRCVCAQAHAARRREAA